MTPRPDLLLVTDLDGTLLDHYSYRWDAAQEALAALRARGIPVITNTSKTLAESRALSRQLDIHQPLIVENGAGIAFPVAEWPQMSGQLVHDGEYRLRAFATSYDAVRELLEKLRRDKGYEFAGFGDMNQEQVREVTGLTREGAEHAMQRHFDEPLIWQGSQQQLKQFQRDVADNGLNITRGGRFLHVMGAADKGEAMTWLAEQYASPRPRLMALGDSDNDVPMLRRADIAVLVRSPAHELPRLQPEERPAITVITEECGPTGWNRAVLDMLEELNRG